MKDLFEYLLQDHIFSSLKVKLLLKGEIDRDKFISNLVDKLKEAYRTDKIIESNGVENFIQFATFLWFCSKDNDEFEELLKENNINVLIDKDVSGPVERDLHTHIFKTYYKHYRYKSKIDAILKNLVNSIKTLVNCQALKDKPPMNHSEDSIYKCPKWDLRPDKWPKWDLRINRTWWDPSNDKH